MLEPGMNYFVYDHLCHEEYNAASTYFNEYIRTY